MDLGVKLEEEEEEEEEGLYENVFPIDDDRDSTTTAQHYELVEGSTDALHEGGGGEQHGESYMLAVYNRARAASSLLDSVLMKNVCLVRCHQSLASCSPGLNRSIHSPLASL
jgi:hypothetical protein